jgi:hypothetical protein
MEHLGYVLVLLPRLITQHSHSETTDSIYYLQIIYPTLFDNTRAICMVLDPRRPSTTSLLLLWNRVELFLRNNLLEDLERGLWLECRLHIDALRHYHAIFHIQNVLTTS